MIKAILIDIDDTLLDFGLCAREAMRAGFERFGLRYEPRMFDTFTAINNGLWRRIERGELTRQQLAAVRWRLVFEKLGIDADGVAFEGAFFEGLCQSAQPVEGARELLAYLSAKYPVYVASNASHDQQLGRLRRAGMADFVRGLFVSESIGHPKPSRAFFDVCFRALRPLAPAQVMMIGDSLTADIEGGVAYGMRTCWLNRAHRPLGEGARPDYEVDRLLAIREIL